jgi:hypothetical protein
MAVDWTKAQQPDSTSNVVPFRTEQQNGPPRSPGLPRLCCAPVSLSGRSRLVAGSPALRVQRDARRNLGIRSAVLGRTLFRNGLG